MWEVRYVKGSEGVGGGDGGGGDKITTVKKETQ